MFKVEIFDMFNASFMDSFMLDDSAEFTQDYMSPKTFDIVAPRSINAEPRNTIKVNREENNGTVFIGWIQSIEREKTRTVLTLAPPLMLLNEKSVQNTSSTDWATNIRNQLYWDFQQSVPSLYSLPLVYYSSYPPSNWGGVQVTYGAVLQSDMTCIIEAAKIYGKFMYFSIGVSGSYLGKIYFGFYKTGNPVTIEADLDNILEKRINETVDGGYNIAILWYPTGSTHNHTDAVLMNGEIIKDYPDASHKNEIASPRLAEKLVNEAPDSSTAWQFFREMLKPSADNYEIELTVKRDDKIVTGLRIGQPVNIINEGRTYSTFVTGVTYRSDTTTYKFGTVRQGLTSKLNEEDS